MRVTLMAFALIPMLVLSIVLSAISLSTSTTELKKSASNSMLALIKEIGTAFDYTTAVNERTIEAYAQAPIIRKLLENPKDPAFAAEAEQYTLNYFSKLDGWEGLYTATWESETLVHSNEGAIGLVLREGDRLPSLQNRITHANGVFNTGILTSPASGQIVMSMYAPVFGSNGNIIGFAGGATLVHNVADHYADVSALGLPSAYVYFVDKEGTMLYHKDESKIGQPVENDAVKAVVAEIAAGNHPEPKCVEYVFKGANKFAGYYVGKNDAYIAVVTGDESDVLSGVTKTTTISVIVLVVGIILCAILSVLVALRVASPLTKISAAIEQLSTGDVTTQCDAKSAIRETAGIARAFHSLKDALNNSMLNVKDSANALSGAIVSVDGKTADNVEHISQINDAIGDVSQTSQVVAEDAQVIAAKSVELGEDIETLTENVTTLFNASQTIKTANDEATDCMQSVYKNGNDSVEAIRNISDKISETNEAIGKIGSAVQAIESIAAQTNLLSLNASIEAARAGEAGKGFAVVADEIRSLADSSAESAREIKQVIEDVIALSNGTVDISNKVFEVITREQEDIEKAQAKFTVLSDSVEASIREINTIKEMTGKLDAIKDDLAKTTSELGAISEELGASAEEVSASCQVVTAACSDTQQSAVEMRNINENMSQAIDFFKL